MFNIIMDILIYKSKFIVSWGQRGDMSLLLIGYDNVFIILL